LPHTSMYRYYILCSAVRVRKRKRGRNKARSVQKEPKTRGGSGKRTGKNEKKCHAGTEARRKEPLSRHGTAGKFVGERIGGVPCCSEGGQSTQKLDGVDPLTLKKGSVK
jgi:hypothetical protein